MSDDPKKTNKREPTESNANVNDAAEGITPEAMLAERIKELYRSPVAMFANIAIAILLVTAMDPMVPCDLLAGWLLLMTVVVVTRFGLWWAYRRAHPTVQSAKRWARRYEVGALATGLVWALAPLVAPLGATLTSQGLVMFAIGGMMAASVFSLAAHPPAFRFLVLPPSLSILVASTYIGDPIHLNVAAMGLVYAALVVVAGQASSRSLAETFRLRLINEALSADLLVARRLAHEANLIKHESLANLSHELRTPLNAVIGFADAMREEIWGPLGHPKYQEYVGNIADSGNHLFSLISDILDFSRAEVGALELSEEPIDMAHLIESCRTMVAGRALERGLDLSVAVALETPRVLADVVKLRQVVINLLTNAVKFTRPGGQVDLTVRPTDEGGVEIAVRDTGVGIEPDDLDRVMEPFVRVKNQGVTNLDGAGLGLALSRRLVERHGGTLTLESKPGVGTKARVHLPPSRVV
ncbi:MAG: HAMP domain-containing histidine kinase [Alphaproteobacteria bacterium]|nr:HAMP domain-containing histidine kinase [Alphaproteobacteria bacterium]